MTEQHSFNPIDLEHRLTILEERLLSTDRALSLQAAEYSRRLEELNHEAKRISDRDKMFLPRESFDGFHSEYRNWRDQVNTSLSIGTGRDKGLSLMWSVILSVGALVGGLAGLYSVLTA